MSDMLSQESFCLVQVCCTKQNAALFHASLYKNLHNLHQNMTQETCSSFLYMFLEHVSVTQLMLVQQCDNTGSAV